ncbi:MAG TPA: hypothetical protein VFL60_06535, partial [Gaiellaceae bacterium]|nr:hypothetical protein [Gaiellaceae bacterium]
MTERRGKRSAVARTLMPAVATLVSAVAGYAAKKGAHYLEQTVLPRLQEARQTTRAERPHSDGGIDDDINDDLARR